MKVPRLVGRYAVAAAGTLYALTLGTLRGRHRRLVKEIASHFGYDDHPARMLPSVAIEKLTFDETGVVLPEPIAADGNVTLLELLVIARLVRERRPLAIFEIGTFDGRTTLALAENSLPDARIHTLDLPAGSATALDLAPMERQFVEKPRSGARLQGREAGKKVIQLFGDSATFDFSAHSADFVFVDGSHAYEYVKRDSLSALRLVGEARGTIVWHDYGVWDGVTRALNELSRTDARFADLRAISGTSLVILDRATGLSAGE
jgi:predicted O-methyltransferase YrrM